MQDNGTYYVLNQLVQFTGLTDRTLRNYITSGLLKGEKIEGVWHFTPEQVEAFISNSAVRPSIVAKHHSHVYDFLLDMKKSDEQMCIILDIPEDDQQKTSGFFCERMNRGNAEVSFSFHYKKPHSRVILKGAPAAVLALVNEYYAAR